MNRIYCISGLGADHRVFANLRIDGCELVPIDWAPFDKTDSVASYAKKMAAKIPGKNPIILGVSFGGMIAVEISKIRETKKIFIVSSAKTAAELTDPGPLVRWVMENGMIPARFFTIPNRFLLSRFGATTSDEKQMLRSIVHDSDGRFMKWALRALLHWDSNSWPANVTHIHGTADRIIPPGNVHPDFWINGGSHIMVYNRAAEISKIVRDGLSV